MALYTDNGEALFYFTNTDTQDLYGTNDEAGSGASAQEIVDLLLNTDIVAFVGDPNSFGAYIRDQVLSVHKFLGLQQVPTMPPMKTPPE